MSFIKHTLVFQCSNSISFIGGVLGICCFLFLSNVCRGQDGLDSLIPENKIFQLDLSCATISPNGKLAFTAGRSKSGNPFHEIAMWDLISGRKLKSIGEIRDTKAMAISPDNRVLAAGGGQSGANAGLRLFDIATGKLIKEIAVNRNPTDHDIYCLAWSPDGQFVATGSEFMSNYDRQNRLVRIWDINRGSLVQAITDHAADVRSVAYSLDGAFLVSGGFDGINIWDVKRGKQVRFIEEKDVRHVVFSPDAQRVASSTYSGEIRIWDVKTGEMIRSYKDSLSGPGYPLLFDDTGKQLIVSVAQRIVAFNGHDDPENTSTSPIWSLDTGRAIDIMGILPHPDKNLLVSWDRNFVRIWDTKLGCEQATLRLQRPLEGPRKEPGVPPEVRSAVTDSTGSRIAVADDDGTVSVWEWPSRKNLLSVKPENRATEVFWSPKGDRLGLVSDNDFGIINVSDGSQVNLQDVKDRRQLRVFGWLSDTEVVVGVSESESTYKPTRLEVVNLTGNSRRSFANDHGEITLLSISADKRWAATAHESKGDVYVWNIESGKQHRTFNTGDGDWDPQAIALSHDGSRLIISTAGGKVEIYNVAKGRRESVLEDTRASRLAISPNGRFFALAIVGGGEPSDRVEVFELPLKLDSKKILVGHNDTVSYLDWTMDSEMLVSGGQDGSVRFYRVALKP
jgi:WD40 repeat protein